MASARSATAARRAAPSRRPARSARVVRWDRLARIAMLVVLGALLYLIIGAARTYLSTYHQASDSRAQLQRLAHENARLRASAQALQSPATLERSARALGMIKPGERSYVVQGLPSN